VERLLEYYETQLTRYEEWVIKRQMRKIRNVIRREKTLNHVMRIVINDKTDEEKREEQRASMYKTLSASTGTLAHHALMHQQAKGAILAQQNLAQGFADPRIYMQDVRDAYKQAGLL
jgi:hypothetical protein